MSSNQLKKKLQEDNNSDNDISDDDSVVDDGKKKYTISAKALKARIDWVDYVCQFSSFRSRLSYLWANQSTGVLEAKDYTSSLSIVITSDDLLYNEYNVPTSTLVLNEDVNSPRASEMSSYSSTSTSTFISKPKRDLSIIPQRLDHFISKEDKESLTKIKPIYATAIEMKPIFDSKLLKLAKKLKMLTNDEDGWDWFDIKIQEDMEAKENIKKNHRKKVPLCGLVSMPLKTKDRIIEKSIEDYSNTEPGPPIIHIKDIIRSSFICHSEEQISKVLKGLDATRGIQIISIKNRFQNSTPAGYRDLIVTVALIVPPIEAIDPSKINTSLNTIPSNQNGGHLNNIVNKNENLSLNLNNLNNTSADDDFDVIKVNNTIGFICEVQIHHLDILSFDKKNGIYPFYVFFRTYFGNAASKPKYLAEKIKVLKKMDQISNDVTLLDEFVDSFLSGNSRVSRDLERLKSFYSLFKKTNELSLAEAVLLRIIFFQRERGLRSDLAGSLSALAAQYTMLKRYNEAILLGEEALLICIEFYGDIHIETATQIKNLGILFACQSNGEKAIELFERSLKIYNKLFVENHINCRSCIKCIIDVYENQENWIDARILRDKLIILSIETIGIQSPQVADLITGVAHIDEIEGHYTNSIRRHLQAKEIYIGFYGQYHLSISSSIISIADIYDQLGMWSLSLSYHKEALNIAINAVGENHEAVAHSYNLIGVILFSVGNLKEARDNLEKSLAIIEECIINLSPNSSIADNTNRLISSASIKNNLAEVLLHFGQERDKEEEKTSDNIDNNVDSGENNVNKLLNGSGYKNLLKALELLDSSLSIRSKVFGMDSLVTRQTLNNQSIAQELARYEKLRLNTEEEFRLCEQRKIDKALAKEQEIIQKQLDAKKLKGEIELMRIRGGYENLKAIKKYEENLVKEASELLNTPPVIEIEEIVHQLQIKGPYDMTSGQQLESSIHAANDLISEIDDLKEKCRYEEALEKCLAALKLAVDVQKASDSHLPIAIVLSYIGVLQEDVGNHSEAEFAFAQSLEILRDIYGDIPHSYLAIILYNLGLNLVSQSKFQEALDNFQESLRLWKQLVPDSSNSSELGAIYHGISCCLVGLMRYADARKSIDLCIDIRSNLYGTDHPDTSASLNLKAIILAFNGGDDLEEAFLINSETLEIREKICGRVHTAYASVLNNEGVLYYLVQDISRSGRILTMSLDIRERQVGMACNDAKVGLFNLTSIFEHPSTAPFAEEIPYLKKGLKAIDDYLDFSLIYPDTGVKLSVFDELIGKIGEEQLKGKTVRQVNAEMISPITKAQNCSYIELLKKQRHTGLGKATLFISHSWDCSFLDVVNSLKNYFRGQDTSQIYIFFDLFCICQHNEFITDFHWLSTIFRNVIANIGHVLLILSPGSKFGSTSVNNIAEKRMSLVQGKKKQQQIVIKEYSMGAGDKVVCLSRLWCLLEVYYAIVTNCKFSITMTDIEQKILNITKLGYQYEFKSTQNYNNLTNSKADYESLPLYKLPDGLSKELVLMINTMFNQIDVRKSSCTKQEDIEQILSLIRVNVGFRTINHVVYENIRDTLIQMSVKDSITENNNEE